MSDALHRSIAASTARFRVRRLLDRRQIDALLSEDRAYAAYALGHLDPGLFEHTEFWLAEGALGAGVVVLSRAVGPVVITVGDPTAVEAILSLHPSARGSYLSTAAPEHMPGISRWYHVGEPLQMQRMSVTRATFAPVEGTVRRLRGADTGSINALYALDDRPSHYTPRQIERAVYFGAFADRQLVSIAGTHVISPMMSIGVVGNVLTHPDHRGHGLAERVTSAVTGTLLEMGCALVVLTADPENTPAVHAYTRLGFEPGALIVEAHLRRRDPLGLGGWWRRRRAEHVDGYEEVTTRPRAAFEENRQ